MRKISVVFILIAFSCREKCIECECKEGGNVFIEESCAYGSSAKNLDAAEWEQYLEEKKGYDEVECKEVK